MMRIGEAWAICDCRYCARTGFLSGNGMTFRIDESDGDLLWLSCCFALTLKEALR